MGIFAKTKLIIMTKKFIVSGILLFGISLSLVLAQPKIIAHRGYWNTQGSAQNSIDALMKADSINVFGSEVDIWISADGVPVVNHDADVTLNGEKLIVEDTPFSTLRQVKLANGEPLPTVEEYLSAFMKCKNTKLIIEFKTHKDKEKENQLVRKVIEIVNQKRLQNRVEYITFGMNLMQQVRIHAPKAKVYYLNGDVTPSSLKAMGAAGFDYHYNIIYRYPQWVQEAQKLGMEVNVWTVNKPEDIHKMIDLKVDYITTDEPLLVRELIKERK